MSKRISCRYQLSEETLGEYVRQLKHSSRPLYATLAALLLATGVGQQLGYVDTIGMPAMWFSLGALLLLRLVLYPDAVMTKRMAYRYRTRFGGVDVPVQVVLGSRIDCTINGVERHFIYDAIDRLTETDNLLVINYPTDAVILRKDGLPEGTSVEEVKELVGRHIAQALGMKEERREAERLASERKRKTRRGERGKDAASIGDASAPEAEQG